MSLNSNNVQSLSDSEFDEALNSKITYKSMLKSLSKKTGKDYSFDIGKIDSDIFDMKNFRKSSKSTRALPADNEHG